MDASPNSECEYHSSRHMKKMKRTRATIDPRTSRPPKAIVGRMAADPWGSRDSRVWSRRCILPAHHHHHRSLAPAQIAWSSGDLRMGWSNAVVGIRIPRSFGGRNRSRIDRPHRSLGFRSSSAVGDPALRWHLLRSSRSSCGWSWALGNWSLCRGVIVAVEIRELGQTSSYACRATYLLISLIL